MLPVQFGRVLTLRNEYMTYAYAPKVDSCSPDCNTYCSISRHSNTTPLSITFSMKRWRT